MITAILWYAIDPMQSKHGFWIPFGVCLQEGARFLFIHLYSKAEVDFSTNKKPGQKPVVIFALTDLTSSIGE